MWGKSGENNKKLLIETKSLFIQETVPRGGRTFESLENPNVHTVSPFGPISCCLLVSGFTVAPPCPLGSNFALRLIFENMCHVGSTASKG